MNTVNCIVITEQQANKCVLKIIFYNRPLWKTFQVEVSDDVCAKCRKSMVSGAACNYIKCLTPHQILCFDQVEENASKDGKTPAWFIHCCCRW